MSLFFVGMSVLDPIGETNELVKSSTNAIKVLGPITVAFFVVLAFILYIFYNNVQGMSVVHAQIMQSQKDMEGKINTIQADETAQKILNNYYLRQLCFNTATSQAQQVACDPPPRVTTAAGL